MTPGGSKRSLPPRWWQTTLALALSATCLTLAAFASGSPTELSGSSTPVKLAVKAKPKGLAVDPRTGQVEYRFRATNAGTQPSGSVRLCARKWPRARVRLRGTRCVAYASLDPGESAIRVFKFRIRARARGKLTEIRLRARGPNVEAAARTVRLRVRRQAGPSKTVIVRYPGVFDPQDVTVRRGERLIWKGAAPKPHTVTFCSAPSPGCDPEAGYPGSPFGWEEFDERISRGERIARTAMRRGTFPYYCDIHRSMRGKVTVK